MQRKLQLAIAQGEGNVFSRIFALAEDRLQPFSLLSPENSRY
jgi:hypothetical protein